MHIHHIANENDDDLDNLATICPACHAVMHFGRSMLHGTIEIWKSSTAQVEIVRQTRSGTRRGLTLEQINTTFGLSRGRHAPSSMNWANDLLRRIDDEPRAELPKPLCAVFVNFNQWQLEP
jgi:hypothetical protein